jgi:hypothetical protein
VLAPGATINVSDVQDVILHALLEAPAPKWLTLQARPHRGAAHAQHSLSVRPLQAAVPRVVVLQLNGLDWHTWTQQASVLACLRDRFQPPVRVYGTSPHTTTGAQPPAASPAPSRACLRVCCCAVQSVLAFMMCRQQSVSQTKRGAARPDPTKRQSTAAMQRACRSACSGWSSAELRGACSAQA